MVVKSSERRNCWLEAAINLTRQWFVSMRNKCFSEIKLKILFYDPVCRIKIRQNASKIFIPPINEFMNLQIQKKTAISLFKFDEYFNLIQINDSN